jgi:proline iminopeptidase
MAIACIGRWRGIRQESRHCCCTAVQAAGCLRVPEAERDGNLTAAYARLLQDPDPAVHEPAAREWCAWEDTHVATVPGYQPEPRYDDPRFRLCFARLVTHYWSNAGFLDDGALSRDAPLLGDIPVLMVHGQLDISGPLEFPWQLAKVLLNAELVVINDEGHGGGQSMSEVIMAATDRCREIHM